MAIPDMSGVSLLAAIRQFSDPVAWAELELLLGLDITEARDGWSADDWVRHDSKVGLKLELVLDEGLPGRVAQLGIARLLTTDYVTASWVRLRSVFEAKLQSGELAATGYIKPVKLTDSRAAVPADKWRFLELDFRNGAASGEGLEIISILIDRAEHASEHETEPEGMTEPAVGIPSSARSLVPSRRKAGVWPVIKPGSRMSPAARRTSTVGSHGSSRPRAARCTVDRASCVWT